MMFRYFINKYFNDVHLYALVCVNGRCAILVMKL